MQKDSKFIENDNYEIVETRSNYCKMSASITNTSLNPYNVAHGGFIFGLADTAAGIAARTKGVSAVTLDSSIQYLHTIKGEKIYAVANCIKEGRTISVYNVEIFDENDKLCVNSTFTYFYIN